MSLPGPAAPSPRSERARLAARRRAEAPVLADLAAAGLELPCLADLFGREREWCPHGPLIASWLPRVTHAGVRRSLVRVLGVPWAGGYAVQPLFAEFRRVRRHEDPTGRGLRWDVGKALEAMVTAADVEELLALARTRRFGPARQMLVLALGRLDDERAREALAGFVHDPDVAGQALLASLRQGLDVPDDVLESLRAHPEGWVRRHVAHALRQRAQPVAPRVPVPAHLAALPRVR